MKNKNTIIIFLVVLLFTNVAFYALGYSSGQGTIVESLPPVGEVVDRDEFLDKILEISGVIDDHYFNDYDWDTIQEGVYRELISSLGDPYSEYLSPKDLENLQISSGRSYGGIGVEVTMNNGRVTVVTPMEGSPGQSAGLLPGDMIVEVDGTNTEGMSLSEVVDLIRGEPDTEVNLGILREGRQDVLKVSIVRGVITSTAVEWDMLQGKLGYLRITRFAEGADQEFVTALTQLRNEGMEELIIDLRGNPGGYLHIVVNIAQYLVPAGDVVYMEDKNGVRVRTFGSQLEERGFDVVVLIDENSASASEILAGALKDRDAGTLIGKNTFGKGSVQSILDFDDGSAVKLTIQKYFSPRGNVIDGVGVAPDIEIEQPEAANFPSYSYKGRLEVGSTGLDVVIINRILYFLGFGEDTDDSTFTESTKQALGKFQSANGLAPTGFMDANTAEKLNEKFTAHKKDNDMQLKEAIDFFKRN
ncbi:S41 family peptidase [Alkalicella caledoniensis]|uniref:S41 family peptidase n=1 Tax=Alkalicella caledoniensis TaxID=2731377 RepID=A0A7G9W6Y1_ALKCA|nr:S41 family peptidase [Alkalicella caledoniensis]QNO14443.1 S41 family peptidase [Alkalicella caledoniensis]